MKAFWPLRCSFWGFFWAHLASAGLSPEEFNAQLIQAAEKQTEERVTYDGSYRRIPYPGGDVPSHIGVCTDVIIRAYRKLGIDLQKLVHEDMKAHFNKYPKKWGMRHPDTNIDHRRVPNLQVFLSRHGRTLPIVKDKKAYQPGEILTWNLGGGLTHIGLLVPNPKRSGHPWVIHNIGAGPQREDVMFDWEVTGRYRYEGPASQP